MRTRLAFLAGAIAGFVLSTVFITYNTLSNYPGFEMSTGVFLETFRLNLVGLSVGSPFAVVLTVALAIGFGVAAVIKRVLTPLAPVAYIVAGAITFPLLFYIIEAVVIDGGVGAFFGARGGTGMGCQAVAGAAAGLVFSVFASRRAV
ncbi:MAG: hypothetical protein KDA46_06660 [Parvularculaceae bacterium]|nr:hypothetical protein [Parvularculaceae bacterium]